MKTRKKMRTKMRLVEMQQRHLVMNTMKSKAGGIKSLDRESRPTAASKELP
jgi:hypothetical protein